MILPDVNVLIYAHRGEVRDHARYRAWLEETVSSDSAFGLSDLVLSWFVRIVTHPRIFNPPSPLSDALDFVDALTEQPNRVPVAPGPNHWAIFRRLVAETGAQGNRIPDAWLAALAIEYGCEWITADRDFARFPGLRWRHPLETFH